MPLLSISYTAPASYNSSVAEKSAIVNVGGTELLGFTALNTEATNTICVMVFDSATVPANGTKPKARLLVPAGTQGSFSFDGMRWDALANGCVLVASSTNDTLTIVATADCIFDVFYVTPATS